MKIDEKCGEEKQSRENKNQDEKSLTSRFFILSPAAIFSARVCSKAFPKAQGRNILRSLPDVYHLNKRQRYGSCSSIEGAHRRDKSTYNLSTPTVKLKCCGLSLSKMLNQKNDPKNLSSLLEPLLSLQEKEFRVA